MINLNKINTINWEKKNICILGAGKSGLGAAKLANHLKANVLLSDIVNKKIDIDETDKFKYEPSGHSDKILKYDLIVWFFYLLLVLPSQIIRSCPSKPISISIKYITTSIFSRGCPTCWFKYITNFHW